MLMGTKPANYRAVTGSLSESPVVSVRSLSAVKQTVSIGCLKEDGSNGGGDLPIEPNQTLLVRACHGPVGQIVRLDEGLFEKRSNVKWNSKHAAGIAVSSSAPAEELAVFAIGLHGDAKQRLSAIPFSDVNTLRSSNAIYTGVPVGQNTLFGTQSFKLRAAFANFSGVPRTATVLLSSGESADSIQKTIATVSVPPSSASTADLAGLLPDGSTANSLVIRTDGNPGEVLTGVQALPAAGSASLVLPWKDQQQFENGGRHPWSVDRSVSSTLLLFNPDPVMKNSSIRVTIYSGKNIWTKQYSLPPLATLAVSLKDIVYKQEPDEKGRKLPPDATGGMLTWSALAKPRIFGKLLQADAIAGISRMRTYACGSINSACGVSVQDPYPNPFLVGQQTSVSGFPLGCTGDSPCSCNDGCGSGSGGGSMSWESEDPGIASVVGSGGSGTYQGNSAGQTWADASVTDNNGCGGSGSTSMTVAGASNWADAFGFPNNGQVILIGQADFNTLVANNLLPAAAGTAVFIPVAGEIIVVIAIAITAGVLVYAAAHYIQANHITVTPPPATGPCTLSTQDTIDPPAPPGGIGSGPVRCIYTCRGYGAPVTMYCAAGKTCAASVPDGWLTPSRDCH